MPYKIAISGFHKSPRFCLLEPVENKPVITDDVCHFLAIDDRAEAHFVFEQHSRNETTDFLLSIAFPDSKRPFSKKVLGRLAIRPYRTPIPELAF